jgi:hypothetical protein
MRRLIRVLGGISIGVLVVALFVYVVLASLGCIDVCSADTPRVVAVIGAIFVGPALVFAAIPWLQFLVQAGRLSESRPFLIALLSLPAVLLVDALVLLASDGGKLFPTNALEIMSWQRALLIGIPITLLWPIAVLVGTRSLPAPPDKAR